MSAYHVCEHVYEKLNVLTFFNVTWKEIGLGHPINDLRYHHIHSSKHLWKRDELIITNSLLGNLVCSNWSIVHFKEPRVGPSYKWSALSSNSLVKTYMKERSGELIITNSFMANLVCSNWNTVHLETSWFYKLFQKKIRNTLSNE